MEQTVDQSPTSGESIPLEQMTINQLKEHAESQVPPIIIPYQVTKKDDILNFIKSGERPKEAEVKVFAPIVYVSRHKATFITVMVGEQERMFKFTNNGACGTYTATSQKDADIIESSEWFQKAFFRIDDENKIPTGVMKSKIVVGARSAMSGKIPAPVPVDVALNQLITDSKKTFAKEGGR